MYVVSNKLNSRSLTPTSNQFLICLQNKYRNIKGINSSSVIHIHGKADHQNQKGNNMYKWRDFKDNQSACNLSYHYQQMKVEAKQDKLLTGVSRSIERKHLQNLDALLRSIRMSWTETKNIAIFSIKWGVTVKAYVPWGWNGLSQVGQCSQQITIFNKQICNGFVTSRNGFVSDLQLNKDCSCGCMYSLFSVICLTTGNSSMLVQNLNLNSTRLPNLNLIISCMQKGWMQFLLKDSMVIRNNVELSLNYD